MEDPCVNLQECVENLSLTSFPSRVLRVIVCIKRKLFRESAV